MSWNFKSKHAKCILDSIFHWKCRFKFEISESKWKTRIFSIICNKYRLFLILGLIMPTLCMTDLIGFRSSLEENEPHKKMKNSVSKWHLSTALTNPIIRFSLMNEMSIQDPSRDYRFSYKYRFITVYMFRILVRNASIHSHHYRDNGPSC